MRLTYLFDLLCRTDLHADVIERVESDWISTASANEFPAALTSSINYE